MNTAICAAPWIMSSLKVGPKVGGPVAGCVPGSALMSAICDVAGCVVLGDGAPG